MGMSSTVGRREPHRAGSAWAWLCLLACLGGSAATQAEEPDAPAPAAVRFAPEHDYGPFVYQSADGHIEGLSVDMLNLLARHAGLQLHMLPARSLSENLALARAGEVDLLSSLRPTPERAEYLAFSRPYVEVPAILVVRKGDAAQSLADLDGQPVAVGKDYAVEGFARQEYPGVDWRGASDDSQAMGWLREGRVRAMVADAASVHFLRQPSDAARLELRDEIGFSYALSFAVRRQDRALLERIDAGLARISPRERIAVIARWMPRVDTPAGSRRDLMAWLGLALILSGIGLALLRAVLRRSARG